MLMKKNLGKKQTVYIQDIFLEKLGLASIKDTCLTKLNK